jgi:hypothetical protein
MFDIGQTGASTTPAEVQEEGMGSHARLGFAGALGLLLLACAGGQSGTEESPADPCRGVHLGAVEPNQATDVGTVAELVAEAGRVQRVPSRVFRQDANAYVDSTLTLEPSFDLTSAEVFT